MAISFAGLLEGQKGLAEERAAAAKAQQDKEWRELIRQDSIDAKEQAQANFMRGIKDKRFTVLAAAGTKYFNDRKPTEKMTQDLAFLNNLVGEVEGGSNWLDSLGNNPALISKAADAVRIAKEKNNYPVIGQDLVDNFIIIGASNDPDAALQEFANTGDLYRQFAEGDIQDDEFYFDFLARASTPVAASTSTYKIIDPKKLGMALPGGEDYTAQSKLYEKEVNKRMTNRFQELTAEVQGLPAGTPERDAADAELVKVTNAQNGSQNNNDTLRDQLFGDSAWDYLAETYESNPQMFGNGAFARPGGPAPVETPQQPTNIPPKPTDPAEIAALERPANEEERNNLTPQTWYVDPTGVLRFFEGN
jgi:hypothetical protein